MRRTVLALALGLLLIFTVGGMANAAAVAQNCQSISLRYRQPLSMETVEAAKEELPGLTFWTQEEGNVSANWQDAQTQIIWYWGEASLVLGKECGWGQTPAPLDKKGCVLSSALAYSLFGSRDVVGLTLSPEKGLEYIVRGVFESSDCMVLLPRKDSEFTAVELPVDQETRVDPEAWVDNILLQSGLPDPQWRLYTGILDGLVRFLAWLPLVFGGIVLGVHLTGRLLKKPYPQRDGWVFLLLAVLALILPLWLGSWPSWLIPSRWSDFSWWWDTAEKIGRQLEVFLLAPGMGRDLSLKSGTVNQLGIALAQGTLCEILRCTFRTGTAAVDLKSGRAAGLSEKQGILTQ